MLADITLCSLNCLDPLHSCLIITACYIIMKYEQACKHDDGTAIAFMIGAHQAQIFWEQQKSLQNSTKYKL